MRDNISRGRKARISLFRPRSHIEAGGNEHAFHGVTPFTELRRPSDSSGSSRVTRSLCPDADLRLATRPEKKRRPLPQRERASLRTQQENVPVSHALPGIEIDSAPRATAAGRCQRPAVRFADLSQARSAVAAPCPGRWPETAGNPSTSALASQKAADVSSLTPRDHVVQYMCTPSTAIEQPRIPVHCPPRNGRASMPGSTTAYVSEVDPATLHFSKWWRERENSNKCISGKEVKGDS
ncbi:hypothetical protein MRX96_002844 [Rhipicephalus microplus]